MSNGNSDKLKRAEQIMLGEPITANCGAVLYPVRMRQYLLWHADKRALVMRQSTLPAKYAVMPYLQALYAIDFDNGFQLGLVQSLRVLIALATQTPLEGINILVSAKDEGQLRAIAYTDKDGNVIRIEPKDFLSIRSILAEQNGEKLPDESENPDLVQAEMDIAEANNADLEYSFETMLDSVSYAGRIPLAGLLDMTVRAFDRLRQAIERDKRFTICATAEMGGMVKFSKGNPYPSWCFDRKKTGSAALESMSDFTARTGISPTT